MFGLRLVISPLFSRFPILPLLFGSFALVPGISEAHVAGPGVHVSYSRQQAHLVFSPKSLISLKLESIQRGAVHLDQGIRQVVRQAGELRLERQNGISEWYRWNRQGIEQGLTLSRPPAGDTAQTLRIDYSTGNAYHTRQQGRDIQLQHRSSGRKVDFRHLVAFDARGTILPSRMLATETGFRLEVNDRDAVYPVVIDPYFSEVTDMLEPGLANGEVMGQGMDRVGDLLAVGTYQRVFLYQKNAQQGWDRIATITGPEGSVRFGLSVKIVNDVVVVADHAFNTNSVSSAGVVYIYQKPAGGWADTNVPTATLTPTTSTDSEKFGIGLDMEGDRVVVTGSGSSVAYVFEKPAGGWSGAIHESATLADNTLPGFKNRNVAIVNNVIYVAGYTNDNATNANLDNQGEVHLYTMAGADWASQSPDNTPDARLVASVSSDDRLGDELITDGNTVYVSAQNKTVTGTRAGAVFVFEKPAGGWPASMGETAMLTSPVLNDNALFGRALALDGDSLAVAAALEDVNQAGGQEGAVYVFTRQGGSWSNSPAVKRLVLPDATQYDNFATTLLLDQQAGILMGGIYRTLQQTPLVKGPIKKLQTTADIAVDLQTATQSLQTSQAFTLNTTVSNLDNEVELAQTSLVITLPAQLTFNGTPGGCVQNSSSEMVCSQTAVAPGAVLQQDIPLQTTSNSGTFTIQASLSGSYKDSIMQNNTASLDMTVSAPAPTSRHNGRLIHKRGGSLSVWLMMFVVAGRLLRRRCV